MLVEEANSARLIEIGVIVAGAFDFVDSRAAQLAIEQADARLRELHPDFAFDFVEVIRPEVLIEGRVEPVELLTQALEERDNRRFDLTIVLTPAELNSVYLPVCIAAFSRPLDSAVISLSPIDPKALGFDSDRDTRIERIARRVSRLLLHAIGHLTGLSPSDHPNDLMYCPTNPSAIDHMAALTADDIEKQREFLRRVADERLEEGKDVYRMNSLQFALRSIFRNRKEILQATITAAPWDFPRRLSGLTIASFSTVAILMMTAEAWDLAINQGLSRVLGLAAFAIVVTTFYVIVRQQVLIRRRQRRSEQSVATTTTGIAVVIAGMTFTWAVLFLVGFAVAWTLFSDQLIANWAATTVQGPSQVVEMTRVVMAAFAASLGLIIGALGASFESQLYFRHVIYVDGEL
ncbi:MAG: hypothetical protein AAF664_09020 [Planctomycetota bacterium]